jgi:hypothetical protein
VARTRCRIRHEFSFVFGRNFPEKLCNCPRAITVENHQTETEFFEFTKNADDGFGGGTLHKGARFGVNRFCRRNYQRERSKCRVLLFCRVLMEFNQISLALFRSIGGAVCAFVKAYEKYTG